MSVTAKQLSTTGAKGKHLDVHIRDLLAVIDDKLQRQEKRWGRNVVPCDLPTDFRLPGLHRANAQRLIYTAIIRSLRERGFTVRLLLEPSKVIIYVEWVTDMSPEEVRSMNRLIARVRIESKNLKDYLESEALPVPAGSLGNRPPAPPFLERGINGVTDNDTDGVTDTDTDNGTDGVIGEVTDGVTATNKAPARFLPPDSPHDEIEGPLISRTTQSGDKKTTYDR